MRPPHTCSQLAARTPSNKQVVRNLALSYKTSPRNHPSSPLRIYVCARDRSKGAHAIQSLHDDPALQSARALSSAGGLVELAARELDVTSQDSVDAFAGDMRAAHPDGIDVLVNNAGIASEGFDAAVVQKTLATNYYGVRRMCLSMIPGMAPGGRVVNISSMSGKLNKYSDSLTARFRGARTLDDVDALMAEFQDAVGRGKHAEEGWPPVAYAVSKAGVTGLSRVLGRGLLEGQSGVLLNACCPGYVDTDMTKHRGKKTPDQGAQLPVRLALGDVGGVGGEFWEFDEVGKW